MVSKFSALDWGEHQDRLKIDFFLPPLPVMPLTIPSDSQGWNVKHLTHTTLDLIASWPQSGIDAPVVGGSKELQYHIEQKGFVYENVLEGLNREIQHIVRMVYHMRWNGKKVAGLKLSSLGTEQDFRHQAVLIRKDDHDLFFLAERGQLSDHLDTVDFYIEKFAPYRLSKRMKAAGQFYRI